MHLASIYSLLTSVFVHFSLTGIVHQCHFVKQSLMGVVVWSCTCKKGINLSSFVSAVEISDEEAEKIMTIQDAVEFLRKSLDVH